MILRSGLARLQWEVLAVKYKPPSQVQTEAFHVVNWECTFNRFEDGVNKYLQSKRNGFACSTSVTTPMLWKGIWFGELWIWQSEVRPLKQSEVKSHEKADRKSCWYPTDTKLPEWLQQQPFGVTPVAFQPHHVSSPLSLPCPALLAAWQFNYCSSGLEVEVAPVSLLQHRSNLKFS